MNNNDAMLEFLANESRNNGDDNGKKATGAKSKDKAKAAGKTDMPKGRYNDEWLEDALTGAGVTFDKVVKRDVTYFNVTCPNESEHTSDSSKSSTACWIWNGRPIFKCHHSHCEGLKFREKSPLAESAQISESQGCYPPFFP